MEKKQNIFVYNGNEMFCQIFRYIVLIDILSQKITMFPF